MLFTPVKPMLLTMGDNNEIVDSDKWIYDIKWDGWRILLHKDKNRIEAFTRHGNNVTAKFPELQSIGKSIKADKAIIDCEGVVLRNGISVFDDFNYRGRLSNKDKINQATITHPATFIAFDILTTDKSIMNKALIERKDILNSIVDPSNELLITPSVVGNGSNVFNITKDKGMEGVVGKRTNSTYKTNHRSHDWLKFKHFKYMDVVILGYKENPFTMIVGSQSSNGKYRPVASVEFGFKHEEKAAFREIAKQIITKVERDVIWVEPSLQCKVQYLEKTSTGSLRIASFKGFNFDKVPKEVY